jgi:hypothetical protein
MKNYIYKVELFSGFYESYFYRQVNAKSEKQAIIQVVSFCTDFDEERAKEYISNELGRKWTVEKFWKEHDLKFQNNDETVGYNLIWLKEFAFDLDTLN